MILVVEKIFILVIFLRIALETVSGKYLYYAMHLTESTTTHSFCLFVISHVIKKLLLSAFDKLLQNDRTVFMGSCCVLFFGYCKKKEIWMKVIQHNNNNNSFAQLVGRKKK